MSNYNPDSILDYRPSKYPEELGAILDRFIQDKRPNNSSMPLFGAMCVDLGFYWHIDPLLFLAITIHESDWGRSKIAIDKNNYWGWGAVDSDPYNKAWYFSTPFGGLAIVSRLWTALYLTQGAKYYTNKTLKGMNQRYSSDQKWCEKVAQWMNVIDEYVTQKTGG